MNSQNSSRILDLQRDVHDKQSEIQRLTFEAEHTRSEMKNIKNDLQAAEDVLKKEREKYNIYGQQLKGLYEA